MRHARVKNCSNQGSNPCVAGAWLLYLRKCAGATMGDELQLIQPSTSPSCLAMLAES